jgi:hypothetical protein
MTGESYVWTVSNTALAMFCHPAALTATILILVVFLAGGFAFKMAARGLILGCRIAAGAFVVVVVLQVLGALGLMPLVLYVAQHLWTGLSPALQWAIPA